MPAAAGPAAQPSFFEALYASRDADAHEIGQGLFLGTRAASSDRKAMQKRKISHILIVHPALPEQHPESFVYRRAPLLDEPTANLLEQLPDALGFLARARAEGGRVFVHCSKGISRSSSVVIALLMLERGLSFAEAFDACERKRPVVYPNVGFQQQLRHLEGLLAPLAGGWEARLRALREVVPRGSLLAPASPLRLREAIDASVGEGLAAAEALAARVLSQPQLLQSRELWKRQGLFFENLERYKTLPGDPGLFDRARATAERLRALPKVFSDSLKGVQLGLAVAKELDTWAKLGDLPASVRSPPPAQTPDLASLAAAHDAEDPLAGLHQEMEAGGPGEGEKADKKREKKREKEKEKERKKSKGERKLEKKLAKLERLARSAEDAALDEHRAAEVAARRADAVAAELDALEEEEEGRRRSAAAPRAASASGSGSRSRSRPRRRP